MKKIAGIIITLVILGAAGFVAYKAFSYYSSHRQGVLEEKTRQLRELQETFVPLRFRLLERTDSAMKVEIRFYSLFVDNIENTDMETFSAGKEIGGPHIFDLEGSEFFIDCVKVRNGELLPFAPEAVWVFPYRVFTDTIAPDDAVAIYPLYDEDGFPSVFNGLNLEPEEKRQLAAVFADITKAETGNALHDMNKVARFRVDRWYDLAVHIKNGALEFIAE